MYLLVRQEVLIFIGIINVIKLNREYEKISLEKMRKFVQLRTT